MEKLRFYYGFTNSTRTAFSFFSKILKDITKEGKIYLQKKFGNEWIADDSDEFQEILNLDLSYENEFLNNNLIGNQIHFKFKIFDGKKIISLIEISEIWDYIVLTILYEKSFDYEEWILKFSKQLMLEQISEDEFYENQSSLPSINNKLVAISKKLDMLLNSRKALKRIFVSMRFDDHSKSVAFDLNKFLSILNIEMVTGMGVEPRSISEKVVERIESNIDLFIILLTESEDSDWINQEIGFAKAKRIPILILKEHCVDKKNFGMLNDNEYISFQHISEAHIGILETINYIEKRDQNN